MEQIKLILDELDIEEVCLSVTGEYSKDQTTMNRTNNDIVIVADQESYTDKIYGREIMGKYYFARHEYISKELPDIDYYEEFFRQGSILN